MKYLSNFWRSLDLALINFEIELDFSWSNKCVISEISKAFRADGDSPVQQVAKATTEATFQINNAKLYVPVVSLSINDNIKLLENLKQRFKTPVSWNKYRSRVTSQPKTIVQII